MIPKWWRRSPQPAEKARLDPARFDCGSPRLFLRLMRLTQVCETIPSSSPKSQEQRAKSEEQRAKSKERRAKSEERRAKSEERRAWSLTSLLLAPRPWRFALCSWPFALYNHRSPKFHSVRPLVNQVWDYFGNGKKQISLSH